MAAALTRAIEKAFSKSREDAEQAYRAMVRETVEGGDFKATAKAIDVITASGRTVADFQADCQTMSDRLTAAKELDEAESLAEAVEVAKSASSAAYREVDEIKARHKEELRLAQSRLDEAKGKRDLVEGRVKRLRRSAELKLASTYDREVDLERAALQRKLNELEAQYAAKLGLVRRLTAEIEHEKTAPLGNVGTKDGRLETLNFNRRDEVNQLHKTRAAVADEKRKQIDALTAQATKLDEEINGVVTPAKHGKGAVRVGGLRKQLAEFDREKLNVERMRWTEPRE